MSSHIHNYPLVCGCLFTGNEYIYKKIQRKCCDECKKIPFAKVLEAKYDVKLGCGYRVKRITTVQYNTHCSTCQACSGVDFSKIGNVALYEYQKSNSKIERCDKLLTLLYEGKVVGCKIDTHSMLYKISVLLSGKVHVFKVRNETQIFANFVPLPFVQFSIKRSVLNEQCVVVSVDDVIASHSCVFEANIQKWRKFHQRFVEQLDLCYNTVLCKLLGVLLLPACIISFIMSYCPIDAVLTVGVLAEYIIVLKNSLTHSPSSMLASEMMRFLPRL